VDMTDVFTEAKRSEIMSRIGGRNTKPEKLVRSLLHRMGYRFRLHVSSLPGTPDIVLPCHHKIIQVNGCFWHGHQQCKKGTTRPMTNSRFWENKISDTIRRDARNEAALTAQGWTVLTVWECETGDTATLEANIRVFMES
jgi:DNA mismatch endonuclease (patch repair protein)